MASKKNKFQKNESPRLSNTQADIHSNNLQPNASQSANLNPTRNSMNTTETLRPVVNAVRIQSSNNPNQTYTPSSSVAINIGSYVVSNLRTNSHIIRETFEFAFYRDVIMSVYNPSEIYQHHITSRNLRLLNGDTVTWRRNLNLPINSNVVPQQSPYSMTNSLQITCNQQASKSIIEDIAQGMQKYFDKQDDNAHQNTGVNSTTSSTSKISRVIPPRANNLKNKGAQVQEIVIGQPCSQCNNCKGYEAHTWRKNCKNCKCPRDCHAVSEFAARSRIGFNSSGDTLDARNIGYTFVPSGLTKRQQVAQYYSLLPNHEVPKIGSPGEVLRSQRLVKQLPKQDLLLTACEFVDQNQRGSYQDFVTARNEIALDVGYVKLNNGPSTCATCSHSVPSGEYCVAAMKMGQATWHPSCFRCCKCDDLLVDLVYCVYKDKIYCERHYAECLKPRCEGCDEVKGHFHCINNNKFYKRILKLALKCVNNNVFIT